MRANPELIVEALRHSHLEVHSESLPQPGHHAGRPRLADVSPRRFFVRKTGPLPPLLRRQCRMLQGLPPPELDKLVLEDPHFTLNRLKDQWRVQAQMHLCEVGNSSTVFRERLANGSDGEAGSWPSSASPLGLVLAIGYERVLYGDGGPFIELNEQQICWKAWPRFHDKSEYHMSYYDEYFTRKSYVSWVERWDKWDANPSRGLLMLYAQKSAVDDRPWAPGAAVHPHARREHGYADYRPGYFYMAADASLITVTGGIAPGSGSTTATGSSHSSLVGSDGPDEPACAAEFAPSSDSDGSACGSASDNESGHVDIVQQRRAVLPLPAESGVAKPPADWELCWEFQQGRCNMGDWCKWRHS